MDTLGRYRSSRLLVPMNDTDALRHGLALSSPAVLADCVSRVDKLQAQVDALCAVMSFGWYSTAADGSVLSINDQTLAWLGRRREEIVGKAMPSDWLTPMSRDRLQSKIARSGERSFDNFSVDLVGKGGINRRVALSSTLIGGSEGVPALRRSLLIDVTEMFRSSERQRIAAIAFESLVGICVTDGNGKILQVNNAFTTITGYNLDDVKGNLIEVIIAQGKDRTAYHEMRLSPRSRGSWEGEIREFRKDGNLLICWLSISFIRADDGTSSYYVGSLYDITENRTYQAEMESASMAKSQFLSVMSHELRTPLSSIMGMFELIQMTGGSEKVNQFATMGLNSSNHLLQLITDILDFSSIEAGRLSMTSAPFRLNQFLDDVNAAASGKRKASTELRVKLDDSLWGLELIGDALRLKQVLINLIGNALKFTDAGSTVLSVSRAGGTPDNPLLEFAVTDTGIGMTPDQQSRLFQPFTQVDMSNVRRFGGTGLGLVISQRIVGLMGGEPITVESRSGGGSHFAFRLSMPVAGEATVPAGVTGHTIPAPPTGRLAGYRLLLVEDNEDVRFVIRLTLETQGAVIDEATDGETGVSAARAASPPHDAVLMDMRMPVKGGLDATRELRARGYTPPIIALTANAFPSDKEDCLAAGMNDYICKPVKVDVLVDMLQKHCGNQT